MEPTVRSLSAIALLATAPLQAQTFNLSDIAFWVGTGSDSSVLVVDFHDDTDDASYAWGFLHDGTATGADMLSAIADADVNFSVDIGAGFLADLTYNDHAGIGGEPDWWGTWSGTGLADLGMNMGIAEVLSNGSWFGCSYEPFDPSGALLGPTLPNLNITAGYGYQAFDPTLLFESPSSIAYHLVGGLFTPLLNRTALKARFREASAQQLATVFAYQQRIITGHVEVMNELSNLGKLREAGDLRRQRNDVLQASVDVSRELYRNAKAGYIEVLLAQQNALSANLELVEVQKRQRFALVDLYKALGGGWSDQ